MRFQPIANDILESVKKMEDSLRRLQRIKQVKSTAANMSSMTSGNNSSAMSDDDKIRVQLFLDVEDLGNSLSEKFDGYKGGSNYEALFKLVEEANPLNSSQTNNQTPTTLTTSSNTLIPANESSEVENTYLI